MCKFTDRNLTCLHHVVKQATIREQSKCMALVDQKSSEPQGRKWILDRVRLFQTIFEKKQVVC